MDGLQRAWSEQALPCPSEIIIQGGGKMMLLAKKKSQFGTVKGPTQCIFDQGKSKGQCNVQATEKPLTS